MIYATSLAGIRPAGILFRQISHAVLSAMPLLSIWQTNPGAVEQFTIEQIVNAAGDGNLKDNSECSKELRSFLSEIDSAKLEEYVERCLSSPFQKGGMVLQDLVNEFGRRLDFEVANGRYQGSSNAIGYDGIWRSPEGHSIVVEVKTTDAYRVSLDTIAEYRNKLLKSDQLSSSSSILIVVGRQDTGELEAQVRGSRHAWDIRLISTDALMRLVSLKQEADAPETGTKIRSLLIPKEYTRLDGMIDVMFTTAKDVEAGAETDLEEAEQPSSDGEKIKGVWQFTKYSLLQAKRDSILNAFGKREDVNLVKKTRALYWSPSKNVRVACTISKRYPKNPSIPYWYAYHPSWDQFLSEGARSFLILGCMDLDLAFAMPRDVIKSQLDFLNTSRDVDDSVMYWHIHLQEDEGEISLLLPKKRSQLSLMPFQLKL
jgi:hypothetical protein